MDYKYLLPIVIISIIFPALLKITTLPFADVVAIFLFPLFLILFVKFILIKGMEGVSK